MWEPYRARRVQTVVLAALACLAAIVVGVQADAQAASEPGNDPAIVAVGSGAVLGTVTPAGRVFKGLPYAAPPVGARRWLPPRPAPLWSGTRDATRFQRACPQPANFPGIAAGPTSEDCLYLNVYTPAKASTKPRPVVVWVHGGGNIAGGAAEYDASRFATTGDLVVVTVDFRLGPLGLLALPELSAESGGSSGNYSLQDQQEALRWVRNHIPAFGGDRNAVTIMGESAGGGDVCAHLVSPPAIGLFHRAIAESGCATPLMTKNDGERIGRTFAEKAGCKRRSEVLACLRALPVDALAAAAGTASFDPLATPLASTPVADGRVLLAGSAEAIENGRFNRVPLIQGTNADEGEVLLSIVDIGPMEYSVVLGTQFGFDSVPVYATYPITLEQSASAAFADLMTDNLFSCTALRTNRAASSRTAVFAYEFAKRDNPLSRSVTNRQIGASHGAELAYFFDVPGRLINDADRQLAATMIGYWSRFARTGDPNGDGAPVWPRTSAFTADRVLSLDDTVAVSEDFGARHRCGFWEQKKVLGRK